MIKKIFLTGSTSYLGSKFIEMYAQDYEIFGVGRTDREHPTDLLNTKHVKQLLSEFEPEIIMHIAADIGRDSTTIKDIEKTNPTITQTLVDFAAVRNIPMIFTSTEATYGGKEDGREYDEDDPPKPRSAYGNSKVLSEEIIRKSGIRHLITRGHRHIGISKNFDRPKQFPDALKEISDGNILHAESTKHFKPVLINNACEIFDHYIKNDSDKQVTINIGIDKAITFYELMCDVAEVLSIDRSLVKPDGEEKDWPMNSLVSLSRARRLGYPQVTYDEALAVICREFGA